MGGAGESRMTAHQPKKLDVEALKAFRDRFALPLSTTTSQQLRFYARPRTAPKCATCARAARRWAATCRARRERADAGRRAAACAATPSSRWRPSGKEMSTTMAVVRMLGSSAAGQGARARASCRSSPTRRAPSAWRTCSARSASIRRSASSTSRRTRARCCPTGKPHDGQMLEEGITEAGALSSWVAAATSYSVHGLAMLPFYIYYSMFGFQRVGDLIWAAADQRARGFLLGATAGPHDARRRGPAAPGRHEPRDRGDRPQLPRLRSGLRLRSSR